MNVRKGQISVPLSANLTNRMFDHFSISENILVTIVLDMVSFELEDILPESSTKKVVNAEWANSDMISIDYLKILLGCTDAKSECKIIFFIKCITIKIFVIFGLMRSRNNWIYNILM